MGVAGAGQYFVIRPQEAPLDLPLRFAAGGVECVGNHWAAGLNGLPFGASNQLVKTA
jgi:hypothetical protein